MLTIKIKTDNQAFVEDWYGEIERCLKDVMEKLNLVGYDSGNIHDSYGNKCGTFKLTNS